MKIIYSITITCLLYIELIANDSIDRNFPKSCLHPALTQNSYYYINPGQDDPTLVYCEDGWTTIFNKIEYKSTGSTNMNYHKDFFAKTWPEYVNGFGAPDTNFWMGLESIRMMVQSEEMRLRIEAHIFGQRKKLFFIEYDSFYIDNQAKQYRLKVGKKVSGNLPDDFQTMNGYKFFTQDNDTNGCAEQFRGGWWFHNCFHVCLTCQPPPTSTSTNWFNNGQWLTFSKSKMMLRPVRVLHKPANCHEIYEGDSFTKVDGIYYIYPDADSEVAVKVYCEMTRGGWTRILNRINKNSTFDRTWNEYKEGFGDLNLNSWIGLNNIQLMTFRRKMGLRIELWNTKNDVQFIEYDSILVYSESEEYKLEVSKSVRGTLIDWLHAHHNSNRFYTKDRDNHNKDAAKNKGAWWFGFINKVCLTCTRNDTETWSSSGSGNLSLIYSFAKMMIKPIDVY